jgi:alpha-D-ribose 1-methylphosphonate 5-triphosphate synthase subunit PhnH
MMAAQQALCPGLADPVFDAQTVFRRALDAMAQPGTIQHLDLDLAPPAPLGVAATALVLALVDFETPLWLDAAAGSGAAPASLRFHCGCPLVEEPAAAAFALIADAGAMPPLSAFNLGSDQYPDRSTTLIIEVAALEGGRPWTLSGPGIKEKCQFAPIGLAHDFVPWLQDNHLLFPRGVDIFLTAGRSLAALPRSTRLEI